MFQEDKNMSYNMLCMWAGIAPNEKYYTQLYAVYNKLKPSIEKDEFATEYDLELAIVEELYKLSNIECSTEDLCYKVAENVYNKIACCIQRKWVNNFLPKQKETVTADDGKAKRKAGRWAKKAPRKKKAE
jgi:ribonuclease I